MGYSSPVRVVGLLLLGAFLGLATLIGGNIIAHSSPAVRHILGMDRGFREVASSVECIDPVQADGGETYFVSCGGFF